MVSTNLYPEKKVGHYLYKVKHRNNKWLSQRKYPDGYMKSAIFYSFEDALAWFSTLP